MDERITAPRGLRQADTERLLNVVAYASLITGYILGVVGRDTLTFWPFALFTGLNIAWAALYARIQRNCDAPPWTAMQLIALALVALAAALCLPLGVGFDWLILAITVTIVSASSRWQMALATMLAASGVTAITIGLAGGGLGQIVSVLMETGPAYMFTALIAVTVRRQWVLRERAEELAANVARAKAELEVAHEELRLRASQAEDLTIARERNRMAREIHDSLGHYLTVLAVELETALRLQERGDADLRAELVSARQSASACLNAVRRSVAALRPAELSTMSLDEALRQLVVESEMALPETAFTLDIEGDTRALAPELHTTLYRCAQEALTNIRKHASATKALVRLRVDREGAGSEGLQEREVELTVLDNGHGAHAGADESGARGSGFGLIGMRERVEALGGTLRAGSEPGHGWRDEIHIPLAGEPAAVAPAWPRLAGEEAIA